MAKFQRKTEPTLTEKAPPGIWHILTNEAAERFAYYGMSFILFTFMTEYLLGPNGQKMPMNASDAKSYYHLFKAANYAFPIIGALMSDIWLGKFRTIIWFSVLYCVGLVVLILDQTTRGLFAGLFLVAMASGIIKPCVSANVGDQFGVKNKHLMAKIYNWFYFAINLGAYVGPLLTPLLLYNKDFGPRWAFGLTAVMMVFALIAFWAGSKRYVHIPAAGIGFVKECFSRQGIMSVLKLAGLYVFIAMFWALFEQTGSSWIEQAKNMNLYFIIDWKADQIPSSQALFVMVMIPLFSYIVYPVVNKIFKLTPLRKICIGMLITASSFIIIVWIANQLNGGVVEKITSTTDLAGYSAINLVDNKADTYWVSGSEPNQSNPQEILIQLREKKKWQVSKIEILLAGQLSRKEILDTIKQNKKLDKQLVKEIKASHKIEDMLVLAEEAFAKAGDNPVVFNYKATEPNYVSVYTADFSSSNIPKLLGELKTDRQTLQWALEKAQKKNAGQEKIEKIQKNLERTEEKIKNYSGYLDANGFERIADIIINQDQNSFSVDLQAQPITHILLVIKSNYGAPQVRLAEVKAITKEQMPADFDKKDAGVWPNVAAVGFQPNVAWHYLGNIILTAAELLVSVTSLEFMYSQAPVQMKSFIMSIYLLAISLGNVYAGFYNKFVKNTRWETGPNYFLLWIYIMLGATVIVIIGSLFYKQKTIIQDGAKQTASSS